MMLGDSLLQCCLHSGADMFVSLCVWDSDQLELIKPIAGGHTHAVYAICPVGATLWSCSWDSTIRIWDTRTLSCLGVLRGYHSDAVSGILPIYNELEAQWEVW
jgi:WD40 repeat protein